MSVAFFFLASTVWAGYLVARCLQFGPEDFYSVGDFGNWSAVRGMAVDAAAEILYLAEIQVKPEFSGRVSEESQASPGRIMRVSFSGAEFSEFAVESLERPYGLALDNTVGKLYWTDTSAGKVQRASLDGSGVEDVVVGLERPTSITIIPNVGNVSDAMVFWLDVALTGATFGGRGGFEGRETRIQMARVPRGAISGRPEVQNVAVLDHGDDRRLDALAGGLAADASSESEADWRIYWTRPGEGKIQSASATGDPDGSVRDVLTILGTPESLVVSSDGKIMYWTDTQGFILYAELDGLGAGEATDLLRTPFFPQGLALDEEADLLYWTDFVREAGKRVLRSDRGGECWMYRQMGDVSLVEGVWWAKFMLGMMFGVALSCLCVFSGAGVRRYRKEKNGFVQPTYSREESSWSPEEEDDHVRLGSPEDRAYPTVQDPPSVIAQDSPCRTGTTELRAAVQAAHHDAEKDQKDVWMWVHDEQHVPRREGSPQQPVRLRPNLAPTSAPVGICDKSPHQNDLGLIQPERAEQGRSDNCWPQFCGHS